MQIFYFIVLSVIITLENVPTLTLAKLIVSLNASELKLKKCGPPA